MTLTLRSTLDLLRRPARTALVTAACMGHLTMAGCDGDKSGDGASLDDNDAEPSGSECDETVTVLDDLAAATSVGVAPQALADAVALPGDSVSWSWADPGMPAPTEFVITTNATPGETALTVSVASVGEARFVDSEPAEPPNGQDSPSIYVECNDRVELDVTLAVATDDGMLAESAQGATLLYVAPGEEGSSIEGVRVSASIPLDMGTLEGALEVVSQQPDDLDEVAYTLSLALGGTDGGVDVVPEISLDALGSGSDGEITWAAIYNVASIPGL